MPIIKKCKDCGRKGELFENIKHKNDCKKNKKKKTPLTITQKRKKLTKSDKEEAAKILKSWGLNKKQVDSILNQRGIPSLNEIEMMVKTGETLQDLRKITHTLLDLGIIECVPLNKENLRKGD
jgi:mevalonate kinase